MYNFPFTPIYFLNFLLTFIHFCFIVQMRALCVTFQLLVEQHRTTSIKEN